MKEYAPSSIFARNLPTSFAKYVSSVEKNSGMTFFRLSASLIRLVPIIESFAEGVATQIRPTAARVVLKPHLLGIQ